MEIVCFTSKIVVLETKSYYIVGLNCNVNKIPNTLFCPVIVLLAFILCWLFHSPCCRAISNYHFSSGLIIFIYLKVVFLIGNIHHRVCRSKQQHLEYPTTALLYMQLLIQSYSVQYLLSTPISSPYTCPRPCISLRQNTYSKLAKISTNYQHYIWQSLETSKHYH